MKSFRSRYKINGSSMIEVLVALAVLSIGLLGLAGLQTTSLRFNNQSYERTQATLLIGYIVDRMRANPQGVRNGSYALSKTSTAPTASNCSSPTSPCTNPNDIALYDQAKWLGEINAAHMLPQGAAEIALPSGAASGLHKITVYWSENDLQMKQDLTVQLP